MNIKEKLAWDYAHSFDDGCIPEADLGPPDILDRLTMHAAWLAGFEAAKKMAMDQFSASVGDTDPFCYEDLANLGEDEADE